MKSWGTVSCTEMSRCFSLQQQQRYQSFYNCNWGGLKRKVYRTGRLPEKNKLRAAQRSGGSSNYGLGVTLSAKKMGRILSAPSQACAHTKGQKHFVLGSVWDVLQVCQHFGTGCLFTPSPFAGAPWCHVTILRCFPVEPCSPVSKLVV